MKRPKSEVIQVGKIVESKTVDRQGVVDFIDATILNHMQAGCNYVRFLPSNIACTFGYDESKTRKSSFRSHMVRDLVNAGYNVRSYANHIEVDLK